VVTKDMANFTVTGRDGTITQQSAKNLTPDQYNGILKVFADNNFASFGARYDEGQSHVTDVGFTDIMFTANGSSKTVTAYNFDQYLPDGLVAIRQELQKTIEFVKTPDESQVRAFAEAWIRDAPTYRYDGSGLTFVSDNRTGTYPVQDMLTYTFTSSQAGYGNRSGSMTAQVITGHTITVTVSDGIVLAAVIDGTWDEPGQFLLGSSQALSFQPKKCEQTTWQVWEANSGRVYIRAPTDEEIIRNYYISVYSIDVRDVKKVQTAQVSCDACSVCPETYGFRLTVNASEMQPLLDEGWTRGG